MTRSTPTAGFAEQLSHRWRTQHHALNAILDDLRQWAYEVSGRGKPRFGESAHRLKQVRQRLVEHFESEDRLSEEFAAIRGEASPEIEANRRQVSVDHKNLLAQLDSLVSRLDEIDPPFESWHQAIAEIELFVNALEQHEEQEADSITWLLPRGS